jgi:hypothetical protein
MDLRETGCEEGRWLELAQDRVQWRALGISGSEHSGSVARLTDTQYILTFSVTVSEIRVVCLSKTQKRYGAGHAANLLCVGSGTIFLGTVGTLSQLPCIGPPFLRTSISLPIVELVHLLSDGWKLSKLWVLTLRSFSLAFKPFSIQSPLTVKGRSRAGFHAELSVNGASGAGCVFLLSPPEREGRFIVTKALLL